ncbi:MAG: SMI1/KNR4 family protein [Verrucomicrobia bacterium]|nr:SMI1/KNR4 family protein [Verrucomicrobiota bacterium]
MSTLEAASKLGVRQLENGTKLIGRTPHVAPEAWLHAVFAPISHHDVLQLEKSLGRKIPEPYRHFLTSFANGLSIYSECLSLDGLRTSYARRGDEVWQPFAIDTPNVYERPRDADPRHFFIGGYGQDGSLLYIDGVKVYRCSRESVEPLHEWNGFETMLIGEVERLVALFDENGRKKNPKAPTTP